MSISGSMRDLRNRIARLDLPEHLRRIYEAIGGEFGTELLPVRFGDRPVRLIADARSPT